MTVLLKDLLAESDKKAKNTVRKSGITSTVLQDYTVFLVPRLDIVPIHKTNLRETKSKKIQCLQGVTFALVFIKTHIFCRFVTPVLHPNQK